MEHIAKQDIAKKWPSIIMATQSVLIKEIELCIADLPADRRKEYHDNIKASMDATNVIIEAIMEADKVRNPF